MMATDHRRGGRATQPSYRALPFGQNAHMTVGCRAWRPTARWERRPGLPRCALIRATALRLLEEPEGAVRRGRRRGARDGARGRGGRSRAERRASVRRNRANLVHWATGQRRASPARRVPPLLGPETLDLARDVVRRGLDDTSLDGYRVGQNIAWRLLDGRRVRPGRRIPRTLREMLDVTSRSIAAFVDDTLGRDPRADRSASARSSPRGTHAERLEVVNLILEGAPITAERASGRLRYELARSPHRRDPLERRRHARPGRSSSAAADGAGSRGRRAPAVHGRSPARPRCGPGSRADGEPDTDAVRAALEGPPGVRVALGSTAAGIDGFRRSHLDALAGQRLMHRMPRRAARRRLRRTSSSWRSRRRTRNARRSSSPARSATWRPPSPSCATRCACTSARSSAPRARHARCSPTATRSSTAWAARTELLPAPLAGRGLEVGLALEIVHWLGPRPAGGAGDQRLRLTVSAGLTDRARPRASGTTTR